MATWPNWIDLVIVTLILRTCYVGFARGFLTELLNLLGLLSVTALACNFHGVVAGGAARWVRLDLGVLDLGSFVTILLLGTFFGVRLVVRKLTHLIKWERIHWTVQGMGLMLGGLRGLWWSGLVLLVLLATGLPYFSQSIEARSILSPQLLKTARHSIEWVANWFPGHTNRADLIPTVKPR